MRFFRSSWTWMLKSRNHLKLSNIVFTLFSCSFRRKLMLWSIINSSKWSDIDSLKNFISKKRFILSEIVRILIFFIKIFSTCINVKLFLLFRWKLDIPRFIQGLMLSMMTFILRNRKNWRSNHRFVLDKVSPLFWLRLRIILFLFYKLFILFPNFLVKSFLFNFAFLELLLKKFFLYLISF